MDRYPAMSRRSGMGRIAFAFALLTLTAGNAAALADNTTIYKYIDSNGNIVFTDHPTKGAEKIEVNPPPPIPMTPVDIPQTPAKPPKPKPTEAQPQSSTPAVPQMRMTPDGNTQPVPQTNIPAPTPQVAPPAGHTETSPSTIPGAASADITGAQSTTATPAAGSGYQSLRVTSPKPGLQIAKPGGTIIVQLALTPALNAAAGDRFRITIDGQTMVDDSTSDRHLISGLKPGQHTLVGMVIRQLNNHAQNLIESKPLTFELAKASK